VGHGSTVFGKSRFSCDPERSEGSAFLRHTKKADSSGKARPQNDSFGFFRSLFGRTLSCRWLFAASTGEMADLI
jgi:hypothetical protein